MEKTGSGYGIHAFKIDCHTTLFFFFCFFSPRLKIFPRITVAKSGGQKRFSTERRCMLSYWQMRCCCGGSATKKWTLAARVNILYNMMGNNILRLPPQVRGFCSQHVIYYWHHSTPGFLLSCCTYLKMCFSILEVYSAFIMTIAGKGTYTFCYWDSHVELLRFYRLHSAVWIVT